MLCDEKGCFLEIVDIIQGVGLTILKGMMEVRVNQIWARVIVEAQVNIELKDGEEMRPLHIIIYMILLHRKLRLHSFIQKYVERWTLSLGQRDYMS